MRRLAVLAGTVVLMGLGAATAGAVTRNKAEGIANARTEKDCNGRFPELNPWACIHTDTSECHKAGSNLAILPEWWCTEVYMQKRRLRNGERICHRSLPINPYGKILTEYVTKPECQPVDPKTAIKRA